MKWGVVPGSNPRSRRVDESGKVPLQAYRRIRNLRDGYVRAPNIGAIPVTSNSSQTTVMSIDGAMFSLRETADGQFIYRCYGWGSETELMATDQAMAADQAVAYSQTHKCVTKAAPAAKKSPKAS